MVIISIALILLSFSLHEFGHAFAMRKYQVEIQEISALGFGPKLFSFKWKKFFPNSNILIKLIPLGGYVLPTEKGRERIKELSYLQTGHIMFAGCAANFLFSAFLNIICYFLEPSTNLLPFIIFNGCLILIGLFPKISFNISLFLSTILCSLLLFFLIKEIVTSSYKAENVGSVVSIAKVAKEESVNLVSSLKFASIMSLTLGLINWFPLFPLDGGRTVVKGIETIFRKKEKLIDNITVIFITLSLLSLAFIFILAVLGDVSTLMK